jgi:cytochrome c oxidase assembly protein subunit 15
VACVLVCATFPLIWVGGLVTTTDAGMAVPDWPSTYGYNLFLYPWQTWLAGPWDLFIEHGHRLLGALVGMLTIVLVLVVWRCDRRRWMRFVVLGALAAVIAQGVLGGQRVLLDDRTLAMLHGCFGPAFFALGVALAAFTSRWWRESSRHAPCAVRSESRTQMMDGADGTRSLPATMTGRLARLALMTTVLAYLQLVLGAQLRHRDPAGLPGPFQTFVVFHILLALVLASHAIWLAARAWRSRRAGLALPAAEAMQGRASPACQLDGRLVFRPAAWLAGLVLVQVALGASTWVLKYGWPAWFQQFAWAQGHLNVSQSLTQVLVTTAHVAAGSLILVLSLLTWLRAQRLVGMAARGGRESFLPATESSATSNGPAGRNNAASFRLSLGGAR